MNVDILRINCAPSWFYLQDYTEMHVQQNINKIQAVYAVTFSNDAVIIYV